MSYVPPSIVAIRHQLGSKAPAPLTATPMRPRTAIDGVPLAGLVARHGSPLFVYSEKTLDRIYAEARATFDKAWPRTTFAWSYKTCYLRGVCSFFHERGSKAEVVSEFEYEKARRTGVEGRDIIFNGPWKPKSALRRAVTEGARIHIDNFEEIDDLDAVCRELGATPAVAIRVNLDAGVHPVWSKFGFNLENGQAMNAVRRIAAGGVLRLDGLHTHIGTFILDPEAYARAVAKLAALGRETERVTDIRIRTLDLGGGFPSKANLKGVYLPPEIAVPPVAAYADAIGRALHAEYPDDPDAPELILECGRHLVDEAGKLVATVTGSKLMADGRRGYLADAGVHLLYTSTWYNHTVETDRTPDDILEPACINGPLCMNIDVVAEGLLLPRLERGTLLTFSPVGAYNVTQSMPFIHCRPAVVMIRKDGSVETLRRAETAVDIEAGEIAPVSV